MAFSIDAFSRVLMGKVTCVFTIEECFGGPFVETTIAVIKNFKAMPVVVRT